MPSVFLDAFKAHGICSFSRGLHGRLDLELVPKLCLFATVRRAFAIVDILPPSTADVAGPRFVLANEPWRIRPMSWFSIVSISPRLMRVATTWMLPTLFSLRFSRGITSFLVVVGLALPLGILIFCCGAFLSSCYSSLHNQFHCTVAPAT